MKIYDRNGKPQSFPFELGERGRGRVYEEVRVDKRRPPTSDEVGYVVFTVGSVTHCVLTAPTGQSGLLLRVNTRGGYTKGSAGGVSPIFGDVKEVAAGEWAEGIAGRAGHGTDILYHVQGPAIFDVVISGGSHKGYGRRYVFVDGTRDYVRMLPPAALIQEIATDEDPRLSDILRQCPQDRLTDTLRDALAAANALEAEQSVVADVTHFPPSLNFARLEEAGWRLPPHHVGGLARSGVDGVLAQGTQALVDVTIGPGGGKRYRYEVVSIEGLDVLARRPIRTSGIHCSREHIVALVQAPDWKIRWTEYKDGASVGEFEANAEGCAGLPWS